MKNGLSIASWWLKTISYIYLYIYTYLITKQYNLLQYNQTTVRGDTADQWNVLRYRLNIIPWLTENICNKTLFIGPEICVFVSYCICAESKYAQQPSMHFSCVALPANNGIRVYHQRKYVAISENDATRDHQSNSSNLVIGKHKSNFDLLWWMIRYTFVQYAKLDNVALLLQFIVCCQFAFCCHWWVHRNCTALSPGEFALARNNYIILIL